MQGKGWAVCREVIPFQGFVGSAQTGVQFIARSSNTAHLLPPSTAPSVDFNETAAPRLPDKMLPPGVSSTVLQPAPIKDEQAQPGSTTIGTVSPEQQLVPNASPLDNGSVSQAGDRAFEAASPEASEGSQGKKGHTAGTGAGGRSPDSNSTTAEGVGSTLSRDYDLQTHSPSPSVNIPKPASSAGLSGPHHNTSPESPNPSPPPNSPSSSPPGALFSAPATSPAAHNAKPAVMFVNTSSPAGPLLGSEPQPKPLYDPSASSPAVHALAPSDLKAPAPQAASGNSTADVQSNSSHSSPSNAMRTNFQQHPNQSDTLLPPALSPLRKENIDRPVLTPAPATVIRAGPPGLLPAAPMPQAGATGQREAAPGPNPPAPEQNLPASQQMPANSSESAQGMSPNSAGTPHPWPGDAPAPDNVPAPGPALSRAAAAPGDSQTVYEKTHTNNLAVIVLGALLGVAIAALLAGRVVNKLGIALYYTHFQVFAL